MNRFAFAEIYATFATGLLSLVAYQGTRIINASLGQEHNDIFSSRKHFMHAVLDSQIRPDLTIILKTSIAKIKENCEQRGDQITPDGYLFLERVQQNLIELANISSYNVSVIDITDKDASSITKEITKEIDDRYRSASLPQIGAEP